ncbi:MAG: DNA polymerase domain-containing protein, partial [Candidatus Diapherotrites archaeon]|nr:DNA polymerase domain-containing protein [Candidatus Diapherotrites archaeon]
QEKIKPIKVEKVEKDLANVVKISFKSVPDLMAGRQEINKLAFVLEKREYDIHFTKRYLIDKNLPPLQEIEFEFKETSLGKEITKLKVLENKETELKFATIDLETHSPGRFSDPKLDQILTISYVDEKERIVFLTKNAKTEHNIKVFPDEKKMFEFLVKKIKEKELDGLVTYNGDSFDLPYLKERARQLKTNFNIGIDGSEPEIKKRGIDNSVKITGTQHIDTYQMIKILNRFGTINLVKFDLESVYEALFGVKKEKLKAEMINKIWETEQDMDRLISYNLEDSIATYELTKRYLPLFMETSKLVHLTLFDTIRAAASNLVENLLFIKAFQTNTLIPNKPDEGVVKQRMLQTFKGGHVREPIPGLHENLAVLDFRSLYPSIMIAHNISTDSLNCKHEKCKTGKNVSPTGDWFCEEKKGFLSSILEEILSLRIQAKKEAKETKSESRKKMLEAKQHALKIVLNSFYGTLGFARFRWYSREAAHSVASWARHYITEVMHKAEEAKYKVVYGDSITKDRFVTVLNSQNEIEIVNIEKFFEQNKNKVETKADKEVISLKGYKALSFNIKQNKTEWQNINELIRHKTNKKIYRVSQKFGETIATEDHSIFCEKDGKIETTNCLNLEGKKLVKLTSLPESTKITKIDLFEELKNYTITSIYKGRTKISKVSADEEFVSFGWTNRKENVLLKRFIEVGSSEFESLCRILGAYIAEGSSSTPETTSSRKGASIASSNIAWLEELQEDYNALFCNVKTCIIPSTKGERNLTYQNTAGKTQTILYHDMTHKMQMMNTLSAVFFKMLCGQKSIGKKLPKFIFNVDNKYKKLLLDKIIEGDGSRKVNEKLGYSEEYKQKNFRLDTKSLESVSGISLLLNQLGINYTIRYREAKQVYTIATSEKFNSRIETHVQEETYSGYVYDLN